MKRRILSIVIATVFIINGCSASDIGPQVTSSNVAKEENAETDTSNTSYHNTHSEDTANLTAPTEQETVDTDSTDTEIVSTKSYTVGNGTKLDFTYYYDSQSDEYILSITIDSPTLDEAALCNTIVTTSVYAYKNDSFSKINISAISGGIMSIWSYDCITEKTITTAGQNRDGSAVISTSPDWIQDYDSSNIGDTETELKLMDDIQTYTKEFINSLSESTLENSVSETVESTSNPNQNNTSPSELYQASDVVFKQWTNSIGDKEYSAYVAIKNTSNENLYLDSCTFDFTDNNGKLLQSDDMTSEVPSIIAPGETGYFISGWGTGSDIGEDVDDSNGLNITANYKVEKATGDFHDFPVSDLSMRKDNERYPTIIGRITNDTDEEESLYLHFILYDANNNILGFSGRNIYDLAPGETQSFESDAMWALPDDVTSNDVDHYDTIARSRYFQF